MTFGRGQVLMLVALGLVAVVHADYKVLRMTKPSQCPQPGQEPQYGMCERRELPLRGEQTYQCVEMLTLGCPQHEGWLPEGSVCFLPSFHPSLAYNCTSGKWTKADESLSKQHREKRFWGAVISIGLGIADILCSIFCSSGSGPPPNKPPEISCPSDVTVTAEAGKVEASVSWDLPTATDPEDGTLSGSSVRIQHGLNPGSAFPEGRSFINYEAKDNGGMTDTCFFTVVVEVVRCPVAQTPRYGEHPVCSGENLYGAQCQFSCDTGYYVNGSSTVTCGRDGSWSDSFPQCLPVSCGDPGTVAGGTVQCDSGHSFPAWCGIVCKPGYRHTGASYISCTADAVWSPNSGCEDNEAPTFPQGCPPDRQEFSGPLGSPSTLTWADPVTNDNSGEAVTLTSDKASGSSFSPGFHTVKVTATDGAGKSRSCKFFIYIQERRCQTLFVFDGHINCDYGSLEGSTCDVSCNNGYQVQGQATVTCQGNKTWSYALPTCEKVTCPPKPPAVEGGEWRCSGSPQYQSACFLTCDSGYTVQPPDLVICNAHGNWTQHGSCQDTEPPVLECPDNVEVLASRLGQETNVTWDPPTVTDNSGENVNATGDVISGSSFAVGVTHVIYTGEDSSGNIGKCQFSVTVTTLSCGPPDFEDSANTRALMLYRCPSGHVHGAQCTLNCTQGYPLLGPSIITCDRDDEVHPPLMSWQFNGTRPKCLENKCPKLDPPVNGALSCLLGNAGWDCLVFCNASWDIPAGSDYRFICTNSAGYWQPKETTPGCTEAYLPGKANLPSQMHYFTGQCNMSLQQIRENFITALEASDWKDACINVPTCVVENVQVTCGPLARRRRSVEESESEGTWASTHGQRLRRQSSGSYALVINFTVTMNYEQNGTAEETYRHYEERGKHLYDLLMNDTEKGVFDLGSLTPDPRYTMRPIPTFDSCPNGTKYVYRFSNPKPSCVGCFKGHYMEDEECKACPVGQYTELDNATSCTLCPAGFTTLTNASGSKDDCIELCTAGSFSPSGFVPCQPCPAGQFQSTDQSMTCDRCPAGTWTEFAGSKRKTDCVAADVKLSADASLSAAMTSQDSAVTLVTWFKVQPNSAMSVDLQISGLPAPTFTMGIFCEGASDALEDLNLVSTLQIPAKQWTRLVTVIDTGENGSVVSVYRGDQHLVESTLPPLSDPFTTKFNVTVLRGRGILSALHAEFGAWNREQIQAPSSSCNEHLAENVLTWSPKPSAIYVPSLCDAVDECQSSPCGPQGVCENRQEGFLCQCLHGWTGNTCQVPPHACYQHQCQNNARCVASGQNYTCECREENSGRLCQLEKVHGSWGDWDEWSNCSDTCEGQQHRQRYCNNPAPSNEGHNCSGHATETQSCGEPKCSVDGEWSSWSDWSSCSATCGGGETTRSRQCDSPAPQYGGADCSGVSNETSICAAAVCPIDGNWGSWLQWSSCSTTCGDGTQSRERSCDNPVPANEGEPCQGSSNQTRSCNTAVCPVCSDLDQYEVTGTHFSCNQTASPYRNTCRVQCTQGYSTPSPAVYTCGEETGHLWNFERENATGAKLTIQYCSPLKTPTNVSMASSIPLPEASCDQKDQVKTQVEYNLKELPCVSEDKCQVVIQSRCDSGISGGDSGSVVVTVDMTAGFGDSLSVVDNDRLDLERFIDAFTKVDQSAAMMVLNDTERLFSVTVNDVTITPDVNALSYTVRSDCPPGASVASDGGCVDCPAGFYEERGQCVVCPLGQYQDQTGSTSCKLCPNHATWDSPGASDLSQCLNPREDEIPPEADESNIGIIIGASIGGGIALIIFIVIIGVCFRKRGSVYWLTHIPVLCRRAHMCDEGAHDAEDAKTTKDTQV